MTHPNPASPADPAAADRAEAALRALGALDRARRRHRRTLLAVALFVIVPIALASAYLGLVGHQRHALELRLGDATFRLVSRRGPFEITTPDGLLDRDPRGIPGVLVVETLEADHVVPRFYDSAAFASTAQRVRVPTAAAAEGFVVVINNRLFEYVAGELQSGMDRWLGGAGRIVVIDLDRLPP